MAPNNIAFCCYDNVPYLFSAAICSYRSAQNLTEKIMTKIPKVSLKDSIQRATKRIQQQMVVLDDDDANETGVEGIGKFVFSLLDHTTKQAMKIPVRGGQCKHWQCFDLEIFLVLNEKVYGGRWRCPACESFVSPSDLEICGLTQDCLRMFSTDVSSNRHQVEFRADRSYRLLKPQKLRYANKKRALGNGKKSTNTNTSGQVKIQNSNGNTGASKKMPETIEVIDLD